MKSPKELAFLHDLYVAPDWGERFAELVDAHIELPKEGRALYVAAGTGSHAMALQERAGEKLELLGVDESDEQLELARAKAIAVNEKTQFQREAPSSLSLTDDQFDLVLGNASMVAKAELREMFSEMVRVAAPGGTVAWWLPTASSFGEFFSIFWEALLNADLEDHGVEVEHLITELPTVSEVEHLAESEGLDDVQSWTAIEEFDYESAEQFFNSPLITDFLLHGWLSAVPEAARQRVREELAKIIDEERHSGEFALTMKATLVMGKKPRVE
ncbi:MAG TPA: class I SAM-dependent methyltransferase [Pyrinomonadaceae bacterium]|jgi:ubiquinone/menaquinone biosynthesis C-methylase UbiE|nr:class I SAM-dependent methyltransferase [Pyrinomonadaceae bacterium]